MRLITCILVLLFSKICLGLQTRTIDELRQCQQKLQQWHDWSARNIPRHEALVQDYEALQREHEKLQREKILSSYTAAITTAIFAVGIGVGLGLAARLVLLWRHLTPSHGKKQLGTLIICALWISGTVLTLDFSGRLTDHPMNFLAATLIYSLPALLFGSIIFWWLNKTEMT
jgi:hypothetical protein